MEYIECSCCGKSIKNTKKENAHYGQTSADSIGYGMCVGCGGDVSVQVHDINDEEAVRRKIGWGGEIFYDARIETLEKSLKEDKLAKFKAMPYGKKILIIHKMCEKGLMI